MRAASRGLDGRYRSKEDDDRTTLVKFGSKWEERNKDDIRGK